MTPVTPTVGVTVADASDHNTRHEDAGADEITAALDSRAYPMLSGLAAARPAAGVSGRVYRSTDTNVIERDNGTTWDEIARGETATRLAQLSEKTHASLTSVTSDQHHAQLHEAAHISGGGDAFTSAQLLEAIVKRLQESTGPTTLTLGAIADGEYLKRSGATVISGTPSGTGAPADASYITTAAEAGLSAEKVLGTAVIMRGLAAAKPAASIAGLIYIETDGSYIVWRDNGATWDEIARGEAGLRLTQLAEKAHASLTGVTADQHHAQSHATAHQDAGADEISIQGLAGTPAELTTHAAAADPHTGYRLESADHTHQTTGAQAGQLDHGLALTGLTDDDHTQYIRHGLAAAINDFLVASGAGAYVKKTLAETLTILGLGIGARVYHSVDQVIPTGTVTILSFDSERYDTDTIHDTVTNNSRLTCKTAGKYLMIANIDFATNVTGRRLVTFLLNGVTIMAQTEWDTNQNAATVVHAVTMYDLAVNDYVECRVFQNSGGNLNVRALGNYSAEFMMHRLG